MEGRPVSLGGMLRPGMRAYLVPLVAGIVLAASAFLPWVVVGETSLKGVPDTTALWIVALGAVAAILAILSLITRKNSRHPLLLVGLIAFGALFLSWRIMPRTVGERVLTASQAFAIVENTPMGEAPDARAGSGIYLGLAASTAIVLFGLTIVIKRASRPYVAAEADDDV
jgi:Zn-dependent protease with chaperone function